MALASGLRSANSSTVLASLRAQLIFCAEIGPSAQHIFGGNAESAFNEKTQCGLPCRPEIEQRAVAQPVEIPQKLFQAIGNAIGALRSGACGVPVATEFRPP